MAIVRPRKMPTIRLTLPTTMTAMGRGLRGLCPG